MLAREYPEHFLDFELIGKRNFPIDRFEFLQMVLRRGLDPEKVGFLPYSIAEWTQKLAVSFAELRRWPNNRIIQLKALFYAGILAHYSGDLVQPLHTTVHFDGIAKKGVSPRSGIHLVVDMLPLTLQLKQENFFPDPKPKFFRFLMEAIETEFFVSHKKYRYIYDHESKFWDTKEKKKIAPEVKSFVEERVKRSVYFTASLFISAWEYSKNIELPDWHKREDNN